MITIHNLEVRFEVEGEGDEAVFARQFQHCIRRWEILQSQRQEHEKRLATERRIVDERSGDF
jgi:hypothetical protein